MHEIIIIIASETDALTYSHLSGRPLSTMKKAVQQQLQQVFSYPDPRKVKGSVRFDLRLLELNKLEVDTVRSEEARKRLLSRARMPVSVSTVSPPRQLNTSSQASCGRDGGQRPSVTGTLGDRRPGSSSLLSRKSSLPTSPSYTYNEVTYSRASSKAEIRPDSPSASWNRPRRTPSLADASVPRERPKSAYSHRQRASSAITSSSSCDLLVAQAVGQSNHSDLFHIEEASGEVKESMGSKPNALDSIESTSGENPTSLVGSVDSLTLTAMATDSTTLTLESHIRQSSHSADASCETVNSPEAVPMQSHSLSGILYSNGESSAPQHVATINSLLGSNREVAERHMHKPEEESECRSPCDGLEDAPGAGETKQQVATRLEACIGSPVPTEAKRIDKVTLEEETKEPTSDCNTDTVELLTKKDKRRKATKSAGSKRHSFAGCSKSTTHLLLEPATGQRSMGSSESTSSLQSSRSSSKSRRVGSRARKQKTASK